MCGRVIQSSTPFRLAIVDGLDVRAGCSPTSTIADGPVILVYAIFSVAAGVAMILGHNIWSGGALPVVVTLFGWLIFAKGLALLLVPSETWTAWLALLQKLHYGYPFYFIPTLAIGGYLTVAGFATRR
jgi:hypothetical protein